MPMLFVFGTLKRGQVNHRLMTGQAFVREATTLPHYRLYDLGEYPGLADDPVNGLSIVGELWQISECCLAELDDFEGVPDWFQRRPVLLEGEPAEADAYFYGRPLPVGAVSGGLWPFTPPVES